MTDIDELIESWKAFLAIACSGKPGDESWIKLPIEKTITALQGMQARIKELEGCMETPRIEDLERIAELELENESLATQRKIIAASADRRLNKVKRLDAALGEIIELTPGTVGVSYVQDIARKARAGD